METTKFLLDEKALPENWYNLLAPLPFGLDPPLKPATREPVGPEAFAPIFPEEIIRQEVTGEPRVPIPEEVREIYSLWRPTPLFRARRLERHLDTPAHIYYKKPYRRVMMQTYGAEVHASPTDLTQAGRNILEEHPDSPGSLGIAISEAVEDAVKNEDAKYSLGSVLNHVLLHQTLIGQEALQQMELAGEYPDVVVGCVGGGSNFGGVAFPFIRENLVNGRGTRIVAVEPSSCPTLTKGRYVYDFGDTAGTTPMMKMYTLGHTFVPSGIHAGGLRYHGDSPIVSALVAEGLVGARAYAQNPTFEAGVTFARAEGIVPAPEVTHAIKATIDLALAAREDGEQWVILFNLCGHGHFDLAAYEAYLADELVDLEYSEEEIERAVAQIPG